MYLCAANEKGFAPVALTLMALPEIFRDMIRKLHNESIQGVGLI
jgi:hypothetical protein